MGETATDTVEADRSAQPSVAAAARVSTTGLVLSVTVAVSFVICLIGFATRQIDVGLDAACVMLLASGLTLSWLTSESRRIRDAQRKLRRRVSR